MCPGGPTGDHVDARQRLTRTRRTQEPGAHFAKITAARPARISGGLVRMSRASSNLGGRLGLSRHWGASAGMIGRAVAMSENRLVASVEVVMLRRCERYVFTTVLQPQLRCLRPRGMVSWSALRAQASVLPTCISSGSGSWQRSGMSSPAGCPTAPRWRLSRWRRAGLVPLVWVATTTSASLGSAWSTGSAAMAGWRSPAWCARRRSFGSRPASSHAMPRWSSPSPSPSTECAEEGSRPSTGSASSVAVRSGFAQRSLRRPPVLASIWSPAMSISGRRVNGSALRSRCRMATTSSSTPWVPHRQWSKPSTWRGPVGAWSTSEATGRGSPSAPRLHSR